MLNFGQAIEAVKEGKAAQRIGWNGKRMMIFLKKGSFDGALLGFKPDEEIKSDHHSTMEGIPFGLFENGASGTACRLPNIQMLKPNGNTVDGWLASPTDMLAVDWQIVE